MIAHSAARFGVPIVLVSGDDVLGREIAERVPGAEYVVVKKAKGRPDAELMPYEEVRIDIENAAKRAMQRLREMKPFPMRAEYRFELRFQDRFQAEIANAYPGLTRLDTETVGYTVSDFGEGFRRAKVLIRLALLDRPNLLFQVVRSRPDSAEILAEYERRLFTRWLEPEKLPRPPSPAAAPAAPVRFHGAP
jgi:D-aminopeptidase